MIQVFKVRNLLIMCFVLFLASCTNTEPPIVEQQDAQPQEEEVSTSHIQEITIAAMKFDPSDISVTQGDTLVFTNNDLVDHNVTQFPDNKWASPTLKPGDSWTYVPTANDSFYCSIHPTMLGAIKIK